MTRWTLDVDGDTFDAVTVQVNRDAQSQLPDPVRDPVGVTVGHGTVAVLSTWSPWADGTLIGRKCRVLADGVPELTGKVYQASAEASADVVSVTVRDLSGPMVNASYTLPLVASGDGSSQPGMHSQWVAEHILGQYGLSPHQALMDGDPALFVSCHGSMSPSIPTVGVPSSGLERGQPAAQPEFAAASWGVACRRGFVQHIIPAGDPLTLSQVSPVRVVAAVDWTVDAADCDVRFRTEGGTGVLSLSPDRRMQGVTVPEGDVGYAAWDYWTDVNGTGRVDLWWRGVRFGSGLPVQPGVEGSVLSRFTIDIRAGAVGAVTVLRDIPQPPPVAPSGTLRTLGSPIELSAPAGIPEGAWATVQQVAAASGGTLWVAGDGTPQALGRADLSVQVPDRVLSGDVIDGLTWTESSTLSASQIRVGYTPVIPTVPSDGETVTDQLTAQKFRPGQTLQRTIRWEGAAQIDQRRYSTEVYDDNAEGWPNRNPVGSARITARQTTATSAVVTVENTSRQFGFVRLRLRMARGSDRVWITGEDASAVVDTTVDGPPFDVDTSVFRQSLDVAADLAYALRADVENPPPEVGALTLTDPSWQLDVGDVVEFHEPRFTGGRWRRAIVSGVTIGSDVRSVTLRTLSDTYDWVDIVIDGDTYNDLDAALTGVTYDQFASAPSDFIGES